ncbi:MAG: U32 family peptidase [Chlamydiia bacterium]
MMTATKFPKLLAPAGSREAFKSALLMGADEIYLGLKQFNARKRADNFTIEDLKELIPLAGQYQTRILVTINVVIQQKEFSALVPLLDQLERMQIGGVIIQDLGVARFIRTHFPRLRMHASTQMAIHNLHGVDVALDLGFKRVVLAREMTLQEIKKIRNTYPSDIIELETFCHGSLCYSYSGLCFFSGAEGGRSGNRGECAYTCRKPYQILSEPGHGFLFSMKDLDTVDLVQQFADIGVDSLKIEGRKKDAQYVATTVKRYRDALDRLRLDRVKPVARFHGAASLFPILEEGKNYSYLRSPTKLFYESRYQENVIDLNNPTHQGVEIGTVERIEERRLIFQLKAPLEAHDGVKVTNPKTLYHAKPQHGNALDSCPDQLKLRYENREIGFAVGDIISHGRRQYCQNAGEYVGIEVPRGLKMPEVGDVVFKVRSNALKRAIDQILATPLPKMRAKYFFEASIHYDTKTGVWAIVVLDRNVPVVQMEHVFPVEVSPHPDGLSKTLNELFSLLGEIEVALEPLEIEIPPSLFVPKNLLKEWKRELSEKLGAYLQAWKPIKMEKEARTPPFISNKAHYIVKIDREELFAFLDVENSIRPSELIFEPKKAFLESQGPQTLRRLKQKADQANVRLRIALPLILRSWDEPYIRSMVRLALELGIAHFECSNIGALSFLKKELEGRTADITADFSLYALNEEAILQLLDLGFSTITLSVEDDRTNLTELLRVADRKKIKLILYKDIPLFIAESCSLTALHNGCPTSKVCGYRTLLIQGEDGEQYEVYHELCKSIVLSKKPMSLSAHKKELEKAGVHQFQFDFLTKKVSFAEAMEVYQKGIEGVEIDNTTDVNYLKKLL